MAFSRLDLHIAGFKYVDGWNSTRFSLTKRIYIFSVVHDREFSN